MDDFEIREMSRQEVENAGVDMSMVRVCKNIRKMATLDRLSFDETVHRNGLNKHLINYIKYCGYENPLDYIRKYLSTLQPYMLERRKDQESKDTYVCVIDRMYRVSVYIKMDGKQFKEMVVSFHEDHINGVAKTNALIKNKTNNLVPVFAKDIGSIDRSTGNVSIDVLITRGMLTLPVNIIGFKCEDVFIVREGDIENFLLEHCNGYIRDLYTSNLNLDFSQIELFSMLQQISFTSYGNDTFSSVSLLVDSLETQKDAISKRAADFALVTFTQNLQLTNEQKQELLDLLTEKYAVSSFKATRDIMYRIRASIAPIENENFNKIMLEKPNDPKIDD